MDRFAGSPIVQYLEANPCWPMKADVLNQLCAVVERHLSEIKLSDEQIDKIVAAKRKDDAERSYQVTNGAAIIPISGVIVKYSRLVNGVSQPRGTSVETISKQLDEAMADEKVKSIFLHIESPGGNISGLPDLADAIFEANAQKPVIAFADDLAASAAYWLGSQASRFYANQSAEVGSIGVYSIYFDSTRMYEEAGIRVIPVASGPHKATGYPGTPISEEQLAPIRSVIDDYYEMFLAHIQRGREARGLSREELRDAADGRTFVAAEAVELKLIDGIKTLRQAMTSALPGSDEISKAAVRPDDLGPTGEGINEITGEYDMSGTEEKAKAAADLKKATDEAAQKAATDERQRCEAVTKVLGGHGDLLAKALADGACNETGAKAVLSDALVEENAGLQKQLTEANDRLKAIADGGGQQPAATSPSDDEAPPKTEGDGKDDGKAATYEAAVKEYTDGGMKASKAHKTAGLKFPKSFEAWTEGNQK